MMWIYLAFYLTCLMIDDFFQSGILVTRGKITIHQISLAVG